MVNIQTSSRDGNILGKRSEKDFKRFKVDYVSVKLFDTY